MINILGEAKSMKLNYFVAEFRKREFKRKRLSKYIVSFDYFDKLLIVLSLTTGSIPIVSVAIVIGAPVGLTSAIFSLAFSICTGILKKCVKNNKK